MGGPQPQQPAQGTAQNPVQRTGDTLTVGCRLPNGLVLQLYDVVERETLRPDGTTRPEKRAEVNQTHKVSRVVLNGNAKFRGGERETLHDIRHGAGLTFGVDGDFFREWLKANADTEIVKRGLVFAHKSNDIAAQAADHRHQTSGLEPINPRALPDEFKAKIETHKAA